MSDTKNYRGSILTHDLFLSSWDDAYDAHNRVEGRSAIDFHIEGEPYDGKKLAIIFPNVLQDGTVDGSTAFGTTVTPTEQWDHARFMQWVASHPLIQDLELEADSASYEFEIGSTILMEFMSDCVQAYNSKNYDAKSSTPHIEEAVCYLYQGYAGIICPYTILELENKQPVFRIIYDKIVGQRIRVH